MFEALTIFVISGLVGTEIWCGYRLHKMFKFRSEERSDARREALRPQAYKKVHDSWCIYRNRKELWDHLQK